jgi:hypothetical protein
MEADVVWTSVHRGDYDGSLSDRSHMSSPTRKRGKTSAEVPGHVDLQAEVDRTSALAHASGFQKGARFVADISWRTARGAIALPRAVCTLPFAGNETGGLKSLLLAWLCVVRLNGPPVCIEQGWPGLLRSKAPECDKTRTPRASANPITARDACRGFPLVQPRPPKPDTLRQTVYA